MLVTSSEPSRAPFGSVVPTGIPWRAGCTSALSQPTLLAVRSGAARVTSGRVSYLAGADLGRTCRLQCVSRSPRVGGVPVESRLIKLFEGRTDLILSVDNLHLPYLRRRGFISCWVLRPAR